MQPSVFYICTYYIAKMDRELDKDGEIKTVSIAINNKVTFE